MNWKLLHKNSQGKVKIKLMCWSSIYFIHTTLIKFKWINMKNTIKTKYNVT